MADIQITTINTALYSEKDLKFNAVLFDGLGGLKCCQRRKDRKKRNYGNEKRKRTDRENDRQGFPLSKVVYHSPSHVYTWR